MSIANAQRIDHDALLQATMKIRRVAINTLFNIYLGWMQMLLLYSSLLALLFVALFLRSFAK